LISDVGRKSELRNNISKMARYDSAKIIAQHVLSLIKDKATTTN
jgi:hypothetical protein